MINTFSSISHSQYMNESRYSAVHMTCLFHHPPAIQCAYIISKSKRLAQPIWTASLSWGYETKQTYPILKINQTLLYSLMDWCFHIIWYGPCLCLVELNACLCWCIVELCADGSIYAECWIYHSVKYSKLF